MHELKYAGRVGGDTANQVPEETPLTVALKEAVDTNLSTANRAYNTLHQLRDRLFGTAPSGVISTGERTEPHSFSAAMHGLNNSLVSKLYELEGLAEELANRL